ncbi:hypothetical protein CH373_16525 [Leptospira perolatii]|uniref:Uncharacterized protein n=1 Tax=Leptospira perolatii TaxID=2023191 RepID=A0A2M9ZJ67_9LEPT|nr:hypothetical protein [Leptospira perolatii]PJZ69546.1 hypothetical protein CH360_11125 [Leptospira perolatii]PJZ72061.1 hypothetical protein CH373_16525 [Leptospira perolatii]
MNPLTPSDPTGPIKGLEALARIRSISHPEVFDGESKEAPFFRVWVQEGSKDGKAKLFWQGHSLDIRTETTLLAGEELVLEKVNVSKTIEWRILERKLSDTTEFGESISPPGMALGELLEKLVTSKEEKPTSMESMISFLKTYLPFLDWKAETPIFNWELPEGEAEGYLGKDEEEKVFVLRVATKNGDPSLYRFSWKKQDASDLVLTATYSGFKMYLHMGQNRKKFMQFLEDSGVRFREVRILYKPSFQRKEWTA